MSTSRWLNFFVKTSDLYYSTDTACALIAASNLNIEPTSALRYGVDDYVAFLENGGYDASAGYEWSDLRFPAAQKAGRLLAERGYVNSLHESWNETTGLQTLANGLDGLKMAVAFRKLDTCYPALAKVQTAAHTKLPIVIHPHGQYLAGTKPLRPRQTMPDGMFSELWYQPTAEWAVNRGIELDSVDTAAVAEQIITRQHLAGLKRMAIDLHHLQARRNGHSFRNPAELAVALAVSGSLGELQVAIRPDFGGQQQELVAAADGRLAATKTGEILTAIAEALSAQDKIRIVSEIAATEIQKSGFKDLSAAHRVINNSIRDIFAQQS